MRTRTFLAAFLLLVVGLAAGGSIGPAYFMASDSCRVLLIQWRASLNGPADGYIANPNNPTVTVNCSGQGHQARRHRQSRWSGRG
jgi:hypothetical protein